MPDMARPSRGVRIGVISDTHGLVRPEALRALRGSALIVHAGDIGTPDVLDALRELAPVVAVRGNNDTGKWARRLPERRTIRVGAARVHVVHDIADLDVDPARVRIDVVVSGHSHQPVIDRRDGVLYLNPGSAGPRRFRLPIALARIVVGATLRARIVTIEPR